MDIMELLNTIELVLNNPETAWMGYAAGTLMLFALVVVSITGFMVKTAKNLKELLKIIGSKKLSPDYTKQIKNETNISPLLTEIRHNMLADRVCILQYHNGIHSIANNSLLKVSMTHERLGLNTTSIMNQVQNWPANYLGTINHKLFNRESVYYPDFKVMGECPELRGLYEQLSSFNTKSIYFFPVVDARGKIFGMGSIQYTDKEHDASDEWLRWANGMFTSIGTLLAGLELVYNENVSD